MHDTCTAEEALADLDRFVAILLDTLPVPVFYKDRDGRYAGCNRSFESFTGLDRCDLVGKTADEIAPLDMASRYAEEDRALYETGSGLQRYDWLVRRADGDLREVRFDKAVLTDRLGRVTGLIGSFVDMTDGIRLAATFDNSNVGIMLVGDDRRIKLANARLAQIFGYESAADMVGMEKRLLHLSDARYDEFAERCHALQSCHAQHHLEYPLRRRDGAAVWCLMSGTPIDRSQPADPKKGMIWVVDDIGMLIKTEQQLRESERRYRRLVESIDEVVFRIDKDGCWSYLNSAFERVTATSVARVLGEPAAQSVHPDDRSRFTAAVGALFGGGLIRYRGQLRCARPSGEVRWIELDARAERENGGLEGIAGTLRDVTESRELARVERLAAFQAGLAEMGASVLHNVGNAMTAAAQDAAYVAAGAEDLGKIAGLLERFGDDILQAPVDPAETLLHLQQTLTEVSRSLRRLAEEQLRAPAQSLQRSVEHMADLIRVQQTGGLDEAPTDVALRTVIDDAAMILSEHIAKRAVRLELEVQAGAERLRTRRNQLLQALINLLKNGSEAIAAARADGGGLLRIVVAVVADDDTLVIRIRDDGCGFDPGAAERLLQFGYTTKPDGRGCGLHSVAHFVRTEGGRLQMQSDGPGTGCEVTLVLPRQQHCADDP
jgi:PAS domain S-box-containing protein